MSNWFLKTYYNQNVYFNMPLSYRRRGKNKSQEGSASCCSGLAKHDNVNTTNNQVDGDALSAINGHFQDDPCEIIDRYVEIRPGLTAGTNPGNRYIPGPEIDNGARGRRRPDIRTRDYTADPEAKTLEAVRGRHHVITEGGDVYAVPERKRKQECVEVLENVLYGDLDSVRGNN